MRQKPDQDHHSTNLKHPPFTFHLPAFKKGVLTASGYVKDRLMVQTPRYTPETPTKIKLTADLNPKELKAGMNDIVFVHAEIVDRNGTVIHNSSDPVLFKLTGDGEIIGQNPRPAEAGIATILVKAGA